MEATDRQVVIIGGGFYGLRIAQHLYEKLGIKRITILEKEKEVMQRASYNNQARVHGGYHYPRSILTALRSRVNLPAFSKEYSTAIKQDFTNYYAIARQLSKVSDRQFQGFFEKIGAPIQTDREAMSYFDQRMIERVFTVSEYAFDTQKLRAIVMNKLRSYGVEIKTGEAAEKVASEGKRLSVRTATHTYHADRVFNTTYSSINIVNRKSGLPIIPLKHELTEMCLVKMPDRLKGASFTIMCGPFFSLMPFPAKGDVYTMSHVRYTPHSEWIDSDSDDIRDGHQHLKKSHERTNFPQMSADIKRYMPDAKDIVYTGESLWEIKTVLPQSEGDDSRPILFKPDYGGLKGYTCIMGGKIDNVYDVLQELDILYGKA